MRTSHEKRDCIDQHVHCKNFEKNLDVPHWTRFQKTLMAYHEKLWFLDSRCRQSTESNKKHFRDHTSDALSRSRPITTSIRTAQSVHLECTEIEKKSCLNLWEKNTFSGQSYKGDGNEAKLWELKTPNEDQTHLVWRGFSRPERKNSP